MASHQLAATDYAEPQGPIPAYAKLEFPGFSYYIQTLNITIGRRPIAAAAAAAAAAAPTGAGTSGAAPSGLSGEPGPSGSTRSSNGVEVSIPPQQAQSDGHVDVDLGPLKSISRLHARIFYLAPGQSLQSVLSVDDGLGIASATRGPNGSHGGTEPSRSSSISAAAGERSGINLSTAPATSGVSATPQQFALRNGITIAPPSPSLSHGVVTAGGGGSGWDMNGALYMGRALQAANWTETSDQLQTGRFILHVLGRNGAFVDDVWAEKDCCIALGKRTKIQIAERVFYFVLPRDVQDEEDDNVTVFGGPSGASILMDPFSSKDSDADSSDSDEISYSDLSDISGTAELDTSDEEDDSEQENDASDESSDSSDLEENPSEDDSGPDEEGAASSADDFVELPPPPPLSTRLPSGGSRVTDIGAGKDKGKGGEYARKNHAHPPPLPSPSKNLKGKSKASQKRNGDASSSSSKTPASKSTAKKTGQNKIPAWMFTGIASRKRKRGQAGSDDEPMKVGTPIGIEALEAAQRRAKAAKAAATKPSSPPSVAHAATSSAGASASHIASVNVQAPLAVTTAPTISSPAAATPSSVAPSPGVAFKEERRATLSGAELPTASRIAANAESKASTSSIPSSSGGVPATSSNLTSSSATPSDVRSNAPAPQSTAAPVETQTRPVSTAQATTATVATSTPRPPGNVGPPTPRRIPIVVGPIPPAALPPPGSKPKPAPGSVEALLETPPIVHHEGKLYLSPPVFGHLDAAELERIESMGAQAALKVLQGYLVDHLKEKIRLQNAARNAQAQAQRAQQSAASSSTTASPLNRPKPSTPMPGANAVPTKFSGPVVQPAQATATSVNSTASGSSALPTSSKPAVVAAKANGTTATPAPKVAGPSASTSSPAPEADPLAALDALAAHPEAAVLIQLLKQQRAEGGGINLTPEQMELLQMANRLAAQQGKKKKKKKKQKDGSAPGVERAGTLEASASPAPEASSMTTSTTMNSQPPATTTPAPTAAAPVPSGPPST